MQLKSNKKFKTSKQQQYIAHSNKRIRVVVKFGILIKIPQQKQNIKSKEIPKEVPLYSLILMKKSFP